MRALARLLLALCTSTLVQHVYADVELPPAKGPNQMHCNSDVPYNKVYTLNDGTHDRCMTVTRPTEVEGPLPVLFWFHAASGSSNNTHCHSLAALALRLRFVVVCTEALQDVYFTQSQWLLPEVTTDKGGNTCRVTDSADLNYVLQIILLLEKEPQLYDTSKLFFAGCSMGSQFSLYASVCMKLKFPQSISSFATHSSGLKIKGDGFQFPADIYRPKYKWGECPECQYLPVRPTVFDDSMGLKACIFDNLDDVPEFYLSSMYLASAWTDLGMKTELHCDTPGGHCDVSPDTWKVLLRCLDDGTQRLLVSGVSFEEDDNVTSEEHATTTIAAPVPTTSTVATATTAAPATTVAATTEAMTTTTATTTPTTTTTSTASSTIVTTEAAIVTTEAAATSTTTPTTTTRASSTTTEAAIVTTEAAATSTTSPKDPTVTENVAARASAAPEGTQAEEALASAPAPAPAVSAEWAKSVSEASSQVSESAESSGSNASSPVQEIIRADIHTGAWESAAIVVTPSSTWQAQGETAPEGDNAWAGFDMSGYAGNTAAMKQDWDNIINSTGTGQSWWLDADDEADTTRSVSFLQKRKKVV